ncbi:hypothetical protein TNIN_480381 [Trichonephila inaurata madagascariensis]|uniref:Uncharacterized protein n=1 Tax=Trichonephila inaurata madagascariensis TaxID=2747483 RepID=A0A8X6YGB8_9ARAC|nr:hypothetical protein TNIN_341021 [Trichonephila inaurata madagascariensis]GFY70168.1 hypothetical protein TNIN_480381 [Trichonephila inaurata madagascariensis]
MIVPFSDEKRRNAVGPNRNAKWNYSCKELWGYFNRQSGDRSVMAWETFDTDDQMDFEFLDGSQKLKKSCPFHPKDKRNELHNISIHYSAEKQTQ